MIAVLALTGLCLAAAPLEPVRAADLHGNRLLFSSDAKPLVPVRLMEGQGRVELVLPSGGTLYDAAGQAFPLDEGATVAVERVSGTPAEVKEAWVLDTLEGEDRSKRQEALKEWEARGVKVRLVPVGGVYGMRGTVFDNRALLVVTDGPLSDAVAERWNVRPVSKTWPVKPSSVKLKVQVGGGVLTTDLVQLVPKGEHLTVKHVEFGVGYDHHGFADRDVRGVTVVLADQAGMLAVVNVVPEQVLVAGILPSEMFATAPIEALKAQAVTARGELFAKIGRRHLADPYLVCSAQHCQVYKGLSAEHPHTNEAAAATAGELAFLDGRVVDSVYSACCGGHTEPSHVVWDQRPQSALVGTVDAPHPGPGGKAWEPPKGASLFSERLDHGKAGGTAVPPLEVPADLHEEPTVRRFLALPRELTFCGRSTFNQKGDAYRWTRRFTQAELTERFADLGVGEVTRISIDERGPGGRLRSLNVAGTKKSARVLRELPVRKRLDNLRSGLFVIDEERAPDGSLIAVTLNGAGFGHGSGMCQQGAIGMAESGYDYRQILRHYYGGAVVRRVF